MARNISKIPVSMNQLGMVLLFLGALFLSGSAWAAPYKMAFVDVPRAMAASDAAKKAREILQKKLAAKQQEVSAMEADIKRMKAAAAERKSVTRQESHADLESELRRKFREYQRLVEDNQAAIDRENGRWTKKITGALLKVIEEIGREEGFTVIFGKGQVLFAAGAIDITDRVLARLNERTRKWF